MHDIRLAIGLLAFVSVAVFTTTLRLLRGRSRTVLDVTGVAVLGLLILYIIYVWGQLWIVKWIPLPSVIVLSNWFPLFMSALAGIVWLRLEPPTLARRLPAMLLIVAGSVLSVVWFVPISSPECQDEWIPPYPSPPLIWPICRQTRDDTCSAAAAATILNTLEIETTEQEMAELCLTKSGTTWLGLYHGLATKLLHSPYRLEFFEGEADALNSASLVSPMLLCCMLDMEDADAVPEYVIHGGWKPGTAHSVVYFGMIGDQHIIGDPSRGYESWSEADMETLWTGAGLKVVKKKAKRN